MPASGSASTLYRRGQVGSKRRRSAFGPTLFAALVATCLAGCTRAAPPDVFLLVVDALRADRVGRPDLQAPPRAFLAELGDRSSVFHRAYAGSSWTGSSIASLLTARLPSQHGVIDFRTRLPDDEVLLAEVLAGAGYRTAAFSGNPLVSPGGGFGQGFETFVNLPAASAGPKAPKPTAAELDRAALEWLDSVRAAGEPRPPVFVYLHYMETHTPYGPTAAILEEVLSARGRTPAQRERLGPLVFGGVDWGKLDEEGLMMLGDLYDAELIGLDRELQRFFAALSQRGFLTHSVVVFTADHGEEFLEHGRFGHGQTLFEEVTRVPLLVRVSDQGRRRDVHETVSQLAVAPTILELAGIDGPTFRGSLPGLQRAGLRSRLAGLIGRTPSAPRAVSELLGVPGRAAREPHHQRSLVEGDAKVIVTSEDEVLGFDLAGDPGERRPAGLPAATLASVLGELKRVTAEGDSAGPGAARSPFDAETQERLRALGYDTHP